MIGKPGFRDWYNDDAIGLAEGDALTIANVKLQVVRILSLLSLLADS